MESEGTDMADGSAGPEGRGPTPPYIAFQSIKTLAKDLKEHGLPGRVDRSVLTNFSGAVASQIMTALKFLHLTDPGGIPTETFRELVKAYGTDDWPRLIGAMLRASYAPLFKLDLQTASPSQFNEAFRT